MGIDQVIDGTMNRLAADVDPISIPQEGDL